MASRLIEKRVGGILLQGFSMAGEEAVITVPEYNMAFDVGRAPREIIPIDTVCLSHGHMDHAAGLAYYFSQRAFQDMSPGCVIVPHQMVLAIQDLLQVWGRIEGHVSPGKIVGVDEDEDVEIRRGLVVRPFRVRHASPALGFSLIEVRKKLKSEYANLSGQQIVELKRAGKTIENRLEIPRVAYCGDTQLGRFLDYDHVRNAEVLIVECTFFDPDHLDRARKGQHTHVRDLPELLERVRSPHVVLGHITRRTGMRDVKRILNGVVSKTDLDRITILMDLPRRPNGADRKRDPGEHAQPRRPAEEEAGGVGDGF